MALGLPKQKDMQRVWANALGKPGSKVWMHPSGDCYGVILSIGLLDNPGQLLNSNKLWVEYIPELDHDGVTILGLECKAFLMLGPESRYVVYKAQSKGDWQDDADCIRDAVRKIFLEPIC